MVARLACLLGHPVGHTRSPAIQNAAFRALGIDAVYLAFDVLPADLEAAIRGLRALGALGANVTIPHKVAAAALCDDLDPTAEATGAVNTLIFGERLIGANTDAEGFRRAVEIDLGLSLAGRRLAVLGVGGACRAVAAAAGAAGAASVTLLHRPNFEADDARAILERLAPRYPATRWAAALHADAPRVLAGTDLLVNATPLGLKPDDPPAADVSPLGAGAAVFDLVYGRETPFVAAARARGLRAAHGATMLLEQAAAAFRLWTGREPPRDAMRTSL